MDQLHHAGPPAKPAPNQHRPAWKSITKPVLNVHRYLNGSPARRLNIEPVLHVHRRPKGVRTRGKNIKPFLNVHDTYNSGVKTDALNVSLMSHVCWRQKQRTINVSPPLDSCLLLHYIVILS